MQTQYLCGFWGIQTPVPVLGLQGLLSQPSCRWIHGLVWQWLGENEGSDLEGCGTMLEGCEGFGVKLGKDSVCGRGDQEVAAQQAP